MTESVAEEIRTLQTLVWSERDPDGRGFAALADAHRRAGDPRKAFEILSEGLVRLPGFTSGHVVAARLYVERGLFAEGELAARRALELDPDNVSAMACLVRALEGAGRSDGAMEARATLAALEPEVLVEEGLAPDDRDVFDIALLEPEAEENIVVLDVGTGAPEPTARGPEEADLPEEELVLGPPVLDIAVLQPDAQEDDPVLDMSALEPDLSEEDAVLDVSALAPDAPDEELVLEVRALEPDLAEDDAVLDVSALGPDAPDEELVLEVSALEPDLSEDDAVLDVSALGPDAPDEELVLEVSALEPDSEDDAVLDVSALGPDAPDEELVLEVSALEPDLSEDDAVLDVSALGPDAPDEELVLEVSALEPALAEDDAVLDGAEPLRAPRDPGAGTPRIYTRTLGELYAKQGFTDRAVEVFRHLVAENPGDATLARRLEELERTVPDADRPSDFERDEELEAIARDLTMNRDVHPEVESPFGWADEPEEEEPAPSDGSTVGEYFGDLLSWRSGREA